jgi:hypothetical protein
LKKDALVKGLVILDNGDLVVTKSQDKERIELSQAFLMMTLSRLGWIRVRVRTRLGEVRLGWI